MPLTRPLIVVTAALLASGIVSSRVAAVSADPGPLPSPMPTAGATPPPMAYERTSYDGTIWQVSQDGATALTAAQWAALGSPAYTTASTEYQRTAILPTVYAVTAFAGAQVEKTVAVTAAQYRAVGSPPIRMVAWISAIHVFAWPTSPELYAEGADAALHKFTYSEWLAAGAPAATSIANTGFVRMSWDASGAIAYMCDIAAGRGGRLTYAQWTALGSPTPRSLERVNGDIVFGGAGGWSWTLNTDDVQYMGPVTLKLPGGYQSDPGPTHYIDLTYPQWRSMGYPAPEHTRTIYPEKIWCYADPPTTATLPH